MKVLPFKIPKTKSTSLVVQEDRQPYFFDALHNHPELQITLILESSGTLIAGDNVSTFRQGDIFVIGKNLPHVFKNDGSYYKGSDIKAESISLFIEENILLNTINSFPELNKVKEFINHTHFGIRIRDNQQGSIRKMILGFIKRKSDENIFYLFHLIYFLSQWEDNERLSGTLLNLHSDEEGERRLVNVLEFTLHRFQDSIAIDEVAEIANLSKSAFCRYFKQRTRKTYVDFLTEVRISKACELLSQTDGSIYEISVESGYNNLSNFNRKFKLLKDMTPMQYRKLMKDTAYFV